MAKFARNGWVRLSALLLALGSAFFLSLQYERGDRGFKFRQQASDARASSVSGKSTRRDSVSKSSVHSERPPGARLDEWKDQAMIEEFRKTSLLIMQPSGLSPNAQAFFGITSEGATEINQRINAARADLQGVIKSSIVKVREDEGRLVEYRVPAFSDIGKAIQEDLAESFRANLGPVVGEAAIRDLHNDLAYFMGWGRYDMRFMVAPRPEDDGRSSASSWAVTLSYLHPGTEKEFTSVTVPADEASRVFGLFEESSAEN